MDLKKLIEQLRAGLSEKLAQRDVHKKVRDDIREACASEERAPSDDESRQVIEASDAMRKIDDEIEAQRAKIAEYEDELRRDEAADRLSREVHPGAPAPGAGTSTVRVGQEPRTYMRETDPKGVQFLRDVALSYTGNPSAMSRLQDHMREEIVEREAAGTPLLERGDQQNRAVGTGAFTGLVVPQYLTDMFAPAAKAGRPFADACRHHDLPEQGMTVSIGRLTTPTNTGLQASEGAAVTEQDADDTLLTINVQTNAGQQTVSRQGVDRGAGVDDTLLEDLFRSYGTTLDSTLLNQATTGLSASATSIAYTDGTPTAAELYPKLLQGPAQVEAAMLDQDQGDTFAVMHSRRWYWIQSQLSTSWPVMAQPGVPGQNSGVNYGEKYGSGFRGLLPAGVPVIVDNNIATNLGAGTNEDEIYFGAKNELHLWEDPSAPMFIRADQTKAANLQILLVVYGYFAYTFGRRPHAQKINGTGLVTPAFA